MSVIQIMLIVAALGFTDSFQVITEAVRILPDDIGGLVPVEFADFDGKRRWNAVRLEEYHGTARGLVLQEAFGDHGTALFPDSRDFGQPLRMLGQDRQRLFPEMADNQDSCGGTDSADQPAAQVPFDAQQRGRHPDFTGNTAELAAVGFMLNPFPGEYRLFPGAQLRQCSHDCGLIPAGPDGNNRPAVFLIAKNGAQDTGFQLLHTPSGNLP